MTPLVTVLEKTKIQLGGSDCWEFQGKKNGKGYGYIRINKVRPRRLEGCHRVIYRDIVGPFNPNLCICHHCDNPSCVRPSHLFPGTIKENNSDMFRKGRGATGERHPKAKLKNREVDAIRHDYETYRPGSRKKIPWCRQMAKTLGVSTECVKDIVNGRSHR